MTKQEFINATHKTPEDNAAQALLITQSMTSLKEIKRAFNTINKTLVRNEYKTMTLPALTAAIEKAAFLMTE